MRHAKYLVIHSKITRYFANQINDLEFEITPQDKALWILLSIASLSLLMVHYFKYSSSLNHLLLFLDNQMPSINLKEWIKQLPKPIPDLIPQLWWCLQHVIGFILVPMLALKALNFPMNSLGWGWGQVHHHWYIYTLLSVTIMSFAYFASMRPDFLHTYPFYRWAHRSWLDLISWEVIYAIQFICVEFFFRGFLLHPFKQRFGIASIFIMSIPYVMLHFQKPWLEAVGAFGFGIILGLLSLMSRSIWGGVLTHISIALTMDLLSLWQQDKLPTQWFIQ